MGISVDKIRCSPYSTIFWNEFRLDPTSCAYNVVADHTIRGKLDVSRLSNAFERFIADHILFDSHLTQEDDESIHWVKNSEPGKLQCFRGAGGQADFAKQAFDVERGPLYRIGVFEVRPGEYDLLVVMHHLIIDGVSGVQLVDGISARYNRTACPKPRDAVEIAAANEKITRDCEALREAGAENFWRGLRPAFTQINTQPQQPRHDSVALAVQTANFSLDKTELRRWRAAQPLRHATPFQLFISAWGALLARDASRDNVSLGFPVSIAAGHDLSLGAHVNVALLSMTSISGRTFRQLYRQNLQFFHNARSADGARFIEWPTHRIARACGATNFDTGFAQTNLRDSLYRFDGCDIQANQRYVDDMGAASLLLEYCDCESRFDFRVRALCEPSSTGQAQRYATDFRFFLRQLLLQPDTPIGNLPFTGRAGSSPLHAPDAATDSPWIEECKNDDPPFDLGLMASNRFDPRQSGDLNHPECRSLTLDAATTTALRKQAGIHGVTLRSVVQFSWHQVLHVWSDANQTVAGTMTCGNMDDRQSTARGSHSPILPLLVIWRPGGATSEMLRQIQQRLAQLDTHSLAGATRLQAQQLPHREPLFHSLVVFEHRVDTAAMPKPWHELARETGERLDYPLAIVATQRENDLTLRFDYDASCFTCGDIDRLMEQLHNVLLALCESKSPAEEEPDILSRAERDQLLREWNPSPGPTPGYGLAERFESMVERHPARIALADETRQYDYRTLNRRANQLAHHLGRQYQQCTGSPIQPDTRIAVCMTRGLDALIALLAVTKAGAAYVPMDAKAPAERHRYILEDSGSRLVVTQADLLDSLQSCAPDVNHVVFDAQCAMAAAEDNPGIYRAPRDLAQVIYTSGTTGKPKGVLIEQGSIVGLLVDSNTLRIDEHDALPQLANLAFDAATLELWGALLNGAKLALSTQPDELCSDARLFEAFMRQQQVTLGFITRSLFDHMYLASPTQFAGFRCLLVGGEALTPDIMRGLAGQTQRPASILNAYGPTECTVFTTTYPIGRVETTGSIPIGRALSQRTCYVLDGQRRLLPRGAIGELYVGGQGVARGYLNLPALTAERFVTDPFARDGNPRMYRTGDRVRWRPEGQLEYIGRNDFQIKIRGYRIEPAEIEARLLMHAGIRQCAVTVREKVGQSGRRHELLAWYVAASPLSADDLSAWLSLKLPDYMIPAHFIPLDALPLTANGKLDRKALLTLEPRAAQSPHVAPRSALEQILHDVWCDVLDITDLSVDDDFYRVGGDSILAILLTTKLRKHRLACPVRAVFEQRTIARLAAWLQNRPPEEDRISEQGALGGPFALLPVQRWFASRGYPQPHHWNQAFAFSIPPLERSRVEKLVAALHGRHDMLRATFRLDAGVIVAQTYQPTLAPPPVTELDAAMDRPALEQRLTQLQSGFDLTHGPLWCVAWIRPESLGGPQHLFIAAHHLVIDTVSWRIIRDDLKTLCEDGSLDQKGSSYRQWVEATARYAARHPAQLAWWQAQTDGQVDYWQRPGITARYETVAIELDVRQTGRLLKETAPAFHTGIDDLLLSALAIALHRWHGYTESWLTLESHGREEIDPRLDVRRTVGWFTCLYPVKLAVKDTLTATIRHVKECLRAIPDKGLGYGVFRYGAAAAAHASALDTHSLPAISFNYLGQFSSSESSGEWQLATQDCGLQIDPDNDAGPLIDINGGVFEHRLQLSLKSRLPRDVAEKLAGDFTQALHGILDLCASLTSRQRSLFTPSDFPHATIELAELDRLQHRHALDNVYRATDGQRELMYFNRVDPDFQIDQVVMEVEGTFAPQRMASAWTHVVAQHDMLRAGFTDRNQLGNPQVFICKEVPLPIQFAAWRSLDQEAERHALNEAILQQRNAPFDFERPPLFRLLIATARNERHILIHTFNHILLDGWSLGILLTEIVAAYAALQQGRPPAACRRSFMPFPVYLSRHAEPGEAQAFWASYLKDAPRNQRLPIDAPQHVDTRRVLRMRCVTSTLTRQLNDALYEFGKAHGYTANQLTQLAWIRVLADHLNEDDIAIGTTMSERPAQIDDVARLVGLFVASPVLRLIYVRQRSVFDLLDDIRGTQSDRQQFAFHELNHYDAQWVPQAPFGSLFVFENMPEADFGSAPPFRLKPLNAISGSNHQTVLCLIPHADGLRLRLFYDTRELREDTVTRLLGQFVAILDDMVTGPTPS
ncbi:non-ribosomal peptide synthase protein (TIGR01720 family)/amino acid adenylation domain-containing protein [Paraburkholderia sp. BL21I4N1]|nr:non-ribosomal peptide synthase protein (TIGR01720 family)/amino acid adenylation domain-containing protein [Paraburkholderia sp. BL21I4N1]